MLTWLLLIVLLPVGLLAIPVTLRFRFHWPHRSQNHVRVRWFFGAVRLNVPAAGGPAARPDTSTSGRPSRRKKRGSGKSLNAWSLVRNGEFRRRIIRLLADAWRALQKKDLRLSVRIGLDDPADTGQLWAFVGPSQGLLAGISGSRIDIQPDFADEIFELYSQGTVRLVPLRLVYLITAAVFSPTVWRGLARARAEA